MKYQRAMAEVIRFDECEEFMAASGQSKPVDLGPDVGKCNSGYNRGEDNTFVCEDFDCYDYSQKPGWSGHNVRVSGTAPNYECRSF